MLKFVEFDESNLSEGQTFIDGLNTFIKEELQPSDSIIAINFRKILKDGKPSSSVLLTFDKASSSSTPANKEKELFFFEIDEHLISDENRRGRRFHEIINEEFSSIINPEDDVLAIEYDKYFYGGKSYSAILLLLNVKF